MNCPFKKNHSRKLTRVLSVMLAVLMLAVCFTGCQKKTNDPAESTASGATPNLIESSAAPGSSETPTETTAATEPEKKNVAIVKEKISVRSSPSVESNVIGQLNAGEEVEVNRVESVSGIQWAYIPLKGWVTVENLDMTNVSSPTTNVSTPANPQATEPADTGTGSGDVSAANTGNGKKGVVIANDLNVRTKASTDGEAVGSLNYGNRVTILETSNGWGRTGMGWISLNYVYMDGNTGTSPCKGVVSGTQLNVRSGPGTEYDSVGSLNKGDSVNILERIKIGKTTWGCTKTGWVSMDYVDTDGKGVETTTDGAGSGKVIGDTVNVRSGPGTDYEVIGSVKFGDKVTISETSTSDGVKWGKIGKGWISMKYIEMD